MKKISIIGLGFVGMPTFLTLSNIKNKSKYTYEVEGIEKPDVRGKQIKKDFNKKKKIGYLPKIKFSKGILI